METYHYFQVPIVENATKLDICQCGKCGPMYDYVVSEWEPVSWLKYINYGSYGFFLFEVLFRMLMMPSLKIYFKDWMNVIDIFCTLTQTIDIVTDFFDRDVRANINNAAQTVIVMGRIGRIVRTLRILRLMKHYGAFRILVYTMKESLKELLLMVVFLLTFSVIFASIIYAVEPDTFSNIPIGIWWALVSMTTVGYRSCLFS